MIAPAARKRAITGASDVAGGASASILEPAHVTSPLTSNRSFIEIGMPAIADGICPIFRATSLARAVASAESVQTFMNARAPSPDGMAIFSRHACVSFSEVVIPRAKSRDSSGREFIAALSGKCRGINNYPLELATTVRKAFLNSGAGFGLYGNHTIGFAARH